MRRVAAAALLMLWLAAMPVAAMGQGEAALDTQALEQALPPEAQAHLGDASPTGVDVKAAAQKLLDSALSAFRQYLKEAMAAGFLILALCVLVAMVSGFVKASGLSVPDRVIDMTAVCAVLIICLTVSGSVISECAEAIHGLSQFSNLLIPAFGIATAVAGKPVTAVATAGATLVFSKLIIAAALGIFIPSLYLYITASAAGAMSESPLMGKIAGFIKWLSTAFFRGFLMVFTGYLSISGVISGSADVVAVKTAQVTISGVVPVVGGIISGVSETLLAGAAVLRSSIGVFGFLGACAICLAPFVKALCHLLVFKVLAAFSTSFAQGGVSRVIDGISSAYSVALGLLGTCCAVQFIAIVVGMVVANT